MSTHIGYLHEGKLIQDAPRDEIYFRPRFLPVAEYLGEPPMNLVTGMLVEDNTERYFELPDGTRVTAGSATGAFPALDAGQEYRIGFRPQDMVYLNGQGAAQAHGQDTVLNMDLAFVETVGSTSTLHLDYDGRELYALHAGPVHMNAGATLSFSLDPEKLYIYDAESGDLIAAGNKIPSFTQK